MNARLLLVATAALLLSRCDCGGGVKKIAPVVAVSPTSLDFGKVKVGHSAETTVKVDSLSQTAVTIDSATLVDAGAPGGASGFELLDVPPSVGGLSSATFRIRFSPTALQAYAAKVVLETNDPDRPTVEIPVLGEGSHPVLKVIAECLASKNCKGTATSDPPAIDYGEELLNRPLAIPQTELPTVNIVNESEVTLVLTRLELTGSGADAFVPVVQLVLPDTVNGKPAMVIEPLDGVNIPIRFKPTSRAITDYAAELVIESDDPTHPEVRVALTGTLAPNTPPEVCANITAVKNPDVPNKTYAALSDWAPLLVPPPGGYDFTATRDIEPHRTTTVQFSSLSNSADPSVCTTDAEDGRNLTFAWRWAARPPGAENVGISGEDTPNASVRPVAIGVYDLVLTVTDKEGLATAVPIRFTAVLKKDIVVQLLWGGTDDASANIDLDLHFVRPSSVTNGADPFSGAFSFFDEAPTANTSGDMNGYAMFRRSNEWAARQYNFNWGSGGLADDPKLHVDDTGTGDLIETISANDPENDPRCATASCRYKILVHYFSDKRDHSTVPAPSCTVSGCREGEACNCPGAGQRCVATEAPTGSAPSGPGECHVAPRPKILVFFRQSPTPSAVIPLEDLVPPDELVLGAPCHLLYVADVVWPALNAQPGTPTVELQGADQTGRIVSPVQTRFGERAQGSWSCAANITINPPNFSATSWYGEEPL